MATKGNKPTSSNFTVLVHSSRIIIYSHNRQLSNVKRLLKSIVHHLLSTKWQTNNIDELLVNTVECVAAKEIDFFSQELVETKYRATLM